MRRIVLIVLGVLAISTNVVAQTAADTIERALAGVAPEARDGAAVIRWDADFGYETLKEGTNSWVCSDFSGKPTRQPFDVSCWSGFSLKYLAQFRRFVAETANLEELLARMEAATADGSMVLPEYGSVNRSISQASAHVQTRLAVPGATTESLGMSDNRGQGRAWVMFAGTLAAHIMIPGY